MSKGYVILAQNTATTNYVRCAEALAISMHRVMPDADITLISDDAYDGAAFNKQVGLPHGDLAPDSKWKLVNDWQVYEASPYEHTIKLEADMFIPRPIDHWFDVLQQKDVVISTTIRDFKGNISSCRAYRRFIDDNALPDVYNAITYFKKSEVASRFFAIVRDIFENWPLYKAELKCNPQEEVSTDWAYAIAAHIIGVENTTMPGFTEMSMVHMKQFVNELPSEDWTNTLVYELSPDAMRIHTRTQSYPLHYHIKTFSDIIIERYA